MILKMFGHNILLFIKLSLSIRSLFKLHYSVRSLFKLRYSSDLYFDPKLPLYVLADFPPQRGVRKRRLSTASRQNHSQRSFGSQVRRPDRDIISNYFHHVREEDRPFDAPPLPRCARGVPQAGASQVGTLKPRSRFILILTPHTHPQTPPNPNPNLTVSGGRTTLIPGVRAPGACPNSSKAARKVSPYLRKIM